MSVNSLGPLNVTGLIAKRDLPKQFEVPPDLKESFQKQLLEQDFAIGRQITCGVLQVNPNIGEKVAYNLKMLFEELGALAADTVPVKDSGEVSENSVDDEDETAQEVFDDSDLKEIFDELRGNKPLLSVQDLKDWGDIQDMIANNVIDPSYLEGAIQEVTGKPKGKAVTITFEQFVEVVDMLQDAMEGMTTDLDEFDENDDFEDDEIINSPAIVQPAPTIVAPPVNQKIKLVLEKIPENSSSENEAKATNAAKDKVDPNMPRKAAIALDGFNLLKGENGKVSVKNLRASTGVLEMLEDGVVTPEQLDDIISSVAGDQKQVDFDLFFLIATKLDQTAEEGNLYLQSDGDDDGEDVEGSANEEDLKEVAKELFDELRGKDKKVSIAAFMAWEDVKDMIEDGLLTKEQMKEMVSEVAGDKKQLDFEQFYDIVSQLDEIAEGAEDEDDLTDDEAEVQVESLESTKGFGSKTALSSKPIPLTAQNGASDEDDEFDGDFEDMSEEEVDEMLREVFDELKGKKGKTLTMKAFKKWEDIEEMLGTGIIDVQTIDDLAEKVGVKKGGDISYEQFKALVELLDEVAGEDDDSEEMSPTDERINDEDERIELDSNDIGGDGAGEDDEMTAEEIESMMKDIFNTLRGSKKTVSVATFLTWDNIQDMKDVIDDETINILLEEVGANRNRKGDLTYTQFSDLINLLEETVSALGDGEGIDTIMDDEDMDDEDEASAANVSATLEEREAIDAEISEERNERNVLDGIDDEGVDIIAKQIYESLKGESESLSVKAFLEWEDVSELIDQGIVKLSTVNLLIVEVGGAKTQTLTFDQFWQLVNLLEDASDAAADKVASGLDDSEDFDEDELEPSPEELEMMAKGIFDDLKNPKTGTVTAKKLKNWEGIKEVLDSGELSKGALNAAIKTVGAEKTNELDFKQFKELMDILEAAMDEGEMDEEPTEPVINASGKGFARAAEPAPVAAAMAAPVKAKNVPVPAAKAEKESEASMITREIYEELVGTGKSLSVDQLREWEDMQEMIEDGSLKRSTLEKALVKIGSLATGDISLKQFMQLIDIIQGAVDDSNLKFEYEDDVKDKDFKTSKKSSVLGSEDEEEENWGDDESGGDFEELTEEEAAQQAFDELVAEGASTISLVDFLQWEDVQDLLEAGALSKDDLATAIENAGVSLELDGIAFDKVTFYFTVAIPTYCC